MAKMALIGTSSKVKGAGLTMASSRNWPRTAIHRRAADDGVVAAMTGDPVAVATGAASHKTEGATAIVRATVTAIGARACRASTIPAAIRAMGDSP